MTGSSDVPPITRIRGGSAGVAAAYDAVRGLARRFDEAGDRMRGWASTGARVLANGDLLASAPLSPVTFALAEERVLAATTGSHGALPSSLAFEAGAVALRATVAALAACDELVADELDRLDHTAGAVLGRLLGEAAPYAAVVGAVVLPVSESAWERLPDETRARLAGEATQGAEAVQEWVDTHPGPVQHSVNAGGGLLDGLLAAAPAGVAALLGLRPSHPSLGAASADLAGLYRPEAPPRVRPRPDLSVRLGTTAPGDLAGLIRHLEQTNALSPPDRPDDQGTIEVQTLTAPDGSVRHVVYLPGTDDLATTPLGQDTDVRDLATNLHLIAREDTAYVAGIEQAMGRAGIAPDDPVLLVGHSQGGMAAAAILADRSPFHVTHAVTAGSPIAAVDDFPTGSHVLSLEHRGDVVPLLDGHDNPDSRQHVTVQFDDHETSVSGNHDLAHYVAGARATDASVREQLDSLNARGYLDTLATSTSQVLQITR